MKNILTIALVALTLFRLNAQQAVTANYQKTYGRLTPAQSALVNDNKAIIQNYLDLQRETLRLTTADVNNWSVSDIYSDKKTGTTYIYLQQQSNGIRVFNAVSSMAVKNGQVVSFFSRFIPGLAGKVNSAAPAYGADEAIRKAAALLDLPVNKFPELQLEVKELNKFIYTSGDISTEPVQITLLYQPLKQSVRLVWNVNIAPVNSDHWWNLRLDAANGTMIDKNDWTVHCDFGSAQSSMSIPSAVNVQSPAAATSSLLPVYNVYALPVEAPSFGLRSLVVNPADPTASPYGWHDTDGQTGDEYTITRGNNVHAYDDIADTDAPGTSADGGATLNFDFPVSFSQAPSTYLDASLTNLFYVNNWIHDVLYQYGLDEAGGNFQENNYGNGGAGNDYVLAECQDGGGTNNANFATPDDGSNGRMQMYLWSGASTSSLQINSPAGIAGSYLAIEAGFGPAIATPITADLVLVDDGTAPTSDACEPIQNGASLAGKIAVIDRGTCTFISKVNAAEALGAIAVIVCNNQAGSPISMGGTGTASVPSVMVSQADGNTIKAALTAGGTVNGTLNPASTIVQDLDGSFDNGIVIHEFGHGVSNRLTGGPNNSNCLFNGEQAGEGWSDYLALLFTIENGDQGTDGRGIGTYAINESVSGGGIRRYQYSTDMTINPLTYADLALSAQVHDVGEVWCVTLWDLTWSLIDQFGYDPNWISGTGGNNIALSLVMEGMKLQPCGPGFIDGRDAILLADDNLFGGAHRCLIWESFARRGMGANALQGDANTAGDETADFTLPSFCLNPTVAPTANFTSDVTTTCFGTVQFEDLSTGIAQAWNWNFGDGVTSALPNPSHTYSAPGTYTVTLIASNSLGADTLVQNAYITVTTPAAPQVNGVLTVCNGQTTTLTAQLTPGDNAEWRDASGTVVGGTSATFTTPALTNTTTFTVRQYTPTPLQNVGPVNGSFGGGGYHNTTFEGKELFTTFTPLRLVSVWVDASGTADRTFNLYSSNGTLLEAQTITVPDGQSRVTLNFDIPVAGDYQIGVTAGSNLYRNNSGASYPYSVNGLVTITASNSTSNPATFYYYVYDWQVQELPCLSQPANVVVEVIPNPTAAYTYSATGLTTQFTNTSSGNVVSYVWDFGDGNTSTQANPQHTYAQSGTYVVTLTVTTSDGCTAVSTQSLSITVSGIVSPSRNELVVFGTRNNISITRGADNTAELAVTVYDVIGQELVARAVYRTEEISISLPTVVAGTVIVRMEQGGQVQHKQVFLYE